MSEYYITTDGELYHYGVKGMRWGVRRNTRLLKSGDSAKREKAALALEKHRTKGTAKIDKLKKKGVKLEKKYEENVVKNQSKAAKLMNKAAKKRKRAYSVFVSDSKTDDLLADASYLETKAKSLMATINQSKAKVIKNNTMISQFEREISNIDQALINRGKEYLKDED
ncbi:MAG: hypothetical protein J6Q60_05575 [Bacteroidaceae bacterium]|nr:hypothetical protein [Bacteroidaceae bacterium]